MDLSVLLPLPIGLLRDCSDAPRDEVSPLLRISQHDLSRSVREFHHRIYLERDAKRGPPPGGDGVDYRGGPSGGSLADHFRALLAASLITHPSGSFPVHSLKD